MVVTGKAPLGAERKSHAVDHYSGGVFIAIVLLEFFFGCHARPFASTPLLRAFLFVDNMNLLSAEAFCAGVQIHEPWDPTRAIRFPGEFIGKAVVRGWESIIFRRLKNVTCGEIMKSTVGAGVIKMAERVPLRERVKTLGVQGAGRASGEGQKEKQEEETSHGYLLG